MDYDSVPLRDFKELNDWETVIFVYQSALKQVETKIDILNGEFQHRHKYNPIEHVKSRIKTPESIVKKLKKDGYESNIPNMIRYVNDIAGIRVVCFFCDDIYRVADYIKKQKDIKLLKEKDYVKNPKKSGYQSIHLIVGVPVTYLEKTTEVRVEIQIRSFAMDYWAELDNQMCYKKNAGQIENVEQATKNYSDVIAKVDNQMLELRRQIEKM